MLEAEDVMDMGDEMSYSPLRTQQQALMTATEWGSGGWWDGRGLLRVKIYDFAIYADPGKAIESLAAAATGGDMGRLRPGGGASGGSDCGVDASCSPASLLVPSASGVDMSLTIRACRNLPLPMLSEEFCRILQRRIVKAGGRPDDPALNELLSYFSRERLPHHVITAAPLGSGQEADAVRKGAAITFSRRSGGELVTEAGGRVLGRVVAPALAEALFDLYLGDQPVSKRAKAAAADALLRLAAGAEAAGGSPVQRYRYRLQPGERLRCSPGTGPQEQEACVLELP
ncbi:hypothetical protein GPECTOR_34g697 [Gonium pectorale]|uniref:Chalcone isomerase domain-containing protein n=1 Tax=Gonium pectorale TaxID=33097 RepID=A0A150GCI8_GONPE|nr:hypothetical protein GPECTOR_34g697 [Gonium pectorale]|eukprot:KXZ47538.1 hypothetical protein GPECTOR_34g697 [Gonium pectorale]